MPRRPIQPPAAPGASAGLAQRPRTRPRPPFRFGPSGAERSWDPFTTPNRSPLHVFRYCAAGPNPRRHRRHALLLTLPDPENPPPMDALPLIPPPCF